MFKLQYFQNEGDKRGTRGKPKTTEKKNHKLTTNP